MNFVIIGRTTRWLDRCLAANKNPTTQNLFPIVQGGVFPDLRQISLQQLIARNAPGYAIGGLRWVTEVWLGWFIVTSVGESAKVTTIVIPVLWNGNGGSWLIRGYNTKMEVRTIYPIFAFSFSFSVIVGVVVLVVVRTRTSSGRWCCSVQSSCRTSNPATVWVWVWLWTWWCAVPWEWTCLTVSSQPELQ